MSGNLHLNLIIHFNYDFYLFRASFRFRRKFRWPRIYANFNLRLIPLLFFIMKHFLKLLSKQNSSDQNFVDAWNEQQRSKRHHWPTNYKKVSHQFNFKRKIFTQQNLISTWNLFIIDFCSSCRMKHHMQRLWCQPLRDNNMTFLTPMKTASNIFSDLLSPFHAIEDKRIPFHRAMSKFYEKIFPYFFSMEEKLIKCWKCENIFYSSRLHANSVSLIWDFIAQRKMLIISK